MVKHINARDLVAYALAAVGGGYVYGSKGQVCSLRLRESCAEANPSQRENILGICAKWDGKRVWDCSGIFRGAWEALWQYRSGGATTIWKTWCTGARGTMDTRPDRPGIALFAQSKTSAGVMAHIGVYVGDGMVVDANGSRTGVLHRPVGAHLWTHWAELDDVDYENALAGVEDIPALWSGHVRTRTGGGISIWTDNTKKVARAKVPEGALVDVLGEADGKGFAQVRYGRIVDMADLQYIVPEDAEEPAQETYRAVVVDVKTGLNLRTSPDMGRNTILLIPPGRIVEVLPDMAVGDFAFVRYEGRAGYCTAARLRRMAEEVAV